MVNCSIRANMYKRVCRDYFSEKEWFTANCKKYIHPTNDSQYLADKINCIIKYIPKGDIRYDHIIRDAVSKSLDMCEKPIFHPAFRLYSPGLRAVFMVILLIYLFLGIAIISDIFMGAIEVITS